MTGVKYGNTFRTAPWWAQDGIGGDTLLMGGAMLDASQFARSDAVTATAAAPGAAQNAMSIPVNALSGPIPSGTALAFSGGVTATLSAPANAGDTALTVTALSGAVAATETATYAGAGPKVVVGGTPVGRTYTERDAGAGFGPAATTDDEFYLLAQDVLDADGMTPCELYRHGRAVRENALPNWAALTTAMKTKIRSLYECFVH